MSAEPTPKTPPSLPAGRVEFVLFDCDGVLVDSEVLSIEVDRQMLAEVGWDLTLEEITERFVGRSHAYYLDEVERHLGHPPPQGWAEQTDQRYWAAYRKDLKPVDGIIAALDRITLPTCVASSGSHEKMRLTLGLTGLWDRFAGRIFSATEVEHGKPAPDLFLHAAGSLGWDPTACVVVEDAPYGVQAGLAAGMHVIAYAGGVNPARVLAAPGVVIITDMHDLPDAIASI